MHTTLLTVGKLKLWNVRNDLKFFLAQGSDTSKFCYGRRLNVIQGDLAEMANIKSWWIKPW